MREVQFSLTRLNILAYNIKSLGASDKGKQVEDIRDACKRARLANLAESECFYWIWTNGFESSQSPQFLPCVIK
mgnify:CR=1 FL=1